MVECLACNDDIYMGHNPQMGDYIICSNCDARFQILDIEPILIDWPEYEDYVDEDEGYYDDPDEENDS